MNPATFGSTATDACTQTTAGAFGPDRITRNVYDDGGRVIEVRSAVGTLLEAAEVHTDYAASGQVEWVRDALGNRTSYEYDGHDRLVGTHYPLPTQGADQSSTTDYEQLTYETLAGGTRSSNLVAARRNRAGESANYGFDALGRTILKDLPGSEPDVSYGYDLLGRLTSASQSGHALGFTWDALGRRRTETGPMGTVTSDWDLAGRRIRITHPGGTYYVDQDYLVTGEMSAIRENGATTGLGVIAAFAYDSRGRRISLTRGNGTTTTYAYDDASRLSQLVQNPLGTAQDLTAGFGYNPASQIVSHSRSNEAYTFTRAAGATASSVNGLNQVTTHGAGSVTHDARGNVTSEGGRTFSYSSENLLTGVTASGWTQTYGYDPLLRFTATTGGGLPRSFAYDGDNLLVTDRNGQFLARFVYGPGENERLYQLDNQGRRNWFHADERGSVVAESNSTGAASTIAYDEYGDQAGNHYATRYAGGEWMPLARQYHMRARVYDPALGRFLQADPIGYGDGMNLYAYVGGDPVNRIDPSRMFYVCTGSIIPQASPCVSESVNFLSVHWLSLPPGPRSAPDGTDAEGSGTGPSAPNTGSGIPGSPGLGTLPGGGHESAHMDDDTIIVTGPRPAVFVHGFGVEPEAAVFLLSGPRLREGRLPPRTCRIVDRQRICNRPYTRTERCHMGRQMRTIAFGIGSPVAVGIGARAGQGLTAVTAVSRGLGWGLAFTGVVGGIGLVEELIFCD
jgi:RHS repeat-associated protein